MDANSCTYGDVWHEFLEKSHIPKESVSDWRPCAEPYFNLYISNAIIVWLIDGGSLIYMKSEGMNNGKEQC